MSKDKAGWRKPLEGSEEKWHFPSAFAAADVKRISLYCPGNTTLKIYNYKGF